MKHDVREKEQQILDECLFEDKKDGLVIEYGNLIYFTIRRTLLFYNLHFTEEDIEDFHIEVFIRLFEDNCRKLRQFDPKKLRLSGWIRLIANQTTLDEIRKKDPHALSRQKDRVPVEDIQELYSFDEKDRLDARQMLALIREIIEEMPLPDKMILKLFYYQQLSLPQVASIIGKNHGSTQVAKSRATNRLKEKIEKKIRVYK